MPAALYGSPGVGSAASSPGGTRLATLSAAWVGPGRVRSSTSFQLSPCMGFLPHGDRCRSLHVYSLGRLPAQLSIRVLHLPDERAPAVLRSRNRHEDPGPGLA